MNRITTNNIIHSIVDSAAKAVPPPVELTPEQQCLERANLRIKEGQRRFVTVFREFKEANGIPPTFNQAVDLIYPLLRSEFKDWSKDDFATLACMTLSINAAASLSDYTI